MPKFKYTSTNPKPLPTQQELKQRFEYCADTGKVFFKTLDQTFFKSSHARNIFNSKHAGNEAGTFCKSTGYKAMYIAGERYLAHRVVYKLVSGEEPSNVLDHLDGDRLNNRYENLKGYSSVAENTRNCFLSKANTTGRAGIYYIKQTGKWRAKGMIQGINMHLGVFNTKELAIEAREKWEGEHGFTARHGVEEPA